MHDPKQKYIGYTTLLRILNIHQNLFVFYRNMIGLHVPAALAAALPYTRHWGE